MHVSQVQPTAVESLVGGRATADLAMERYADGDDAAFGELYDELAPRLERFLRRRVRRRDQVEDFLQQTLLAMHRARGSFSRGAPVMPWAFAIARRLVIDAVRRGCREVYLSAEEQAARMAELMAVGDEADQVVFAKDLARRLQAKLSRLPEGQRLAYELVKLDGLSPSDAADVLGISVGALKVRTHRAMEALRCAAEGDCDGT